MGRKKINKVSTARNKKINKKKEVVEKKKPKRRKAIIKVKSIGMEMDMIYSIISACQVNKEEQTLIIDPVEFPVIENILKDSLISFEKTIKQDGIHYLIKPPPEIEISDEEFIFDEEMEDELHDDEQCF